MYGLRVSFIAGVLAVAAGGSLGALVGLLSTLVVGLLRESGVTMGVTTLVLGFCSMMTLAWGLGAGQLVLQG